MYEEDSAEFHLPVQTTVAAVEKVTTAPISVAPKMTTENKISDQALFEELNSVSEEVIACRNRVLQRIS